MKILLSEWKKDTRQIARRKRSSLCNLTRLTFWSVIAFPRNFNTRSIPGISIHPRTLRYPFFRLARPPSSSPDRLSSRRKYYKVYSGSTNRQSSYLSLLLSDSSNLGSLILSHRDSPFPRNRRELGGFLSRNGFGDRESIIPLLQ